MFVVLKLENMQCYVCGARTSVMLLCSLIPDQEASLEIFVYQSKGLLGKEVANTLMWAKERPKLLGALFGLFLKRQIF